jgi:hypothetical protein
MLWVFVFLNSNLYSYPKIEDLETNSKIKNIRDLYRGISDFKKGYQPRTGGTRWRSWLRHCGTSRKVAGSILDGVIGIFHWHNPSVPHYGPVVDWASNRNEYQEYFLVGKGGRCVGLTLPTSCADCLEIWEPQPPGTLRIVQACNGIALPFTLTAKFIVFT